MDLSSRQAWLTDGAGHVTAGPFAARGGKSGAATPVGTFTVQKKVKNYWSKAFDAPMPNSVFFKPGYAFHAGSPAIASNGCIHLNRGGVAAVLRHPAGRGQGADRPLSLDYSCRAAVTASVIASR